MKKYSKFFAIALLAITTMFGMLTSCEKTESISATQSIGTDVEKELDSLVSLCGSHSGQTKFNVMAATSSSQIPSGLYMMNVGYRNHYQHIQQYVGECSWTSYALGTNMVADYMGRNYPLSHTRITAIKAACGNNNNMNTIASYAITNESRYATTRYDGFSGASGSSTARLNAIKYMLNMLDDGMYTGNPFVAIVGVNGLKYSSNANDIDPTNISGKSYWINKINTTQHYVVVSAIQWQSGGAGSVVYYYDPISTTGTLQSCSLTRFLDAMLAGSINYNFMSIKPWLIFDWFNDLLYYKERIAPYSLFT